MKTHEYCYRCMEETDFTDGVCDICGYDKERKISSFYMTPGAELHSRYIIGDIIGANGEGANYIGYDKSLGHRVIVREFLPKNLCTRVKGRSVIGVSQAHLAEYKALMAEFTDLHKILAKYRDTANINAVLDLFMENNTVYVISEYIEGITLTDYLNDNAGELTWAQAFELFPPVLDTMAKIHSEGIIHRGLCPDTIYMTADNEMRIGGFSISAIRTKGAELETEMFEGYAAPEQYSVANRQGTWTDVYALCAVLYRVLTGSKPIEAMSRVEKDNLSAPNDLNPNIPKYVSDAIMQGMSLLGRDRIQTVPALSALLFSENAGDTEEFHAGGYIPPEDYNNDYDDLDEDDEEDEEPAEESEYVEGYNDDYSYDENGNNADDFDNNLNNLNEHKKSSFDSVKAPMIIGIVVLMLLLIGVLALFQFLDRGNTSGSKSSTENNSDTTKATVTALSGDSEMPDLVGDTLDEATALANGWFNIQSTEEYNDDYAEGEIFWQDVKAGKTFNSGQTVNVKVSKGKRYIELPSYKNKKYTEYIKELDALGIPYQYIAKENTGKTDGQVVEISGIDDPKKYDRESQQKVIVYYAYTPETYTYYVNDEPETQAQNNNDNSQDTAAPETQAPETQAQDTQPQNQDGGDDNGGDANNDGGDVYY